MTVDANSFIDDSFNDGDWSPQQAAQYLEMSMNGDTAQADSIETPADTDADEADKPATEVPTEDETSSKDDDVETVVLARDGVHTIPYETHVAYREGERAAKEALAAANAELEILRKQPKPDTAAATQQDKDIETAQAAINAGVNPDYFGDFSEEALAEGINKLIDERVSAQVDARVAKALEPMQQKEQESAADAHMRTIYDAHQDADSIVESGEFNSWKAQQPSYIQAALDGVLQQGTAEQVVELLNNYKQSTTSTPAADAGKPSTDDLKAKAREAIKNTAPAIPASLSDIPGGHKGALDIREQMDAMSGIELVEAMADWSPEKREQYLNNTF